MIREAKEEDFKAVFDMYFDGNINKFLYYNPGDKKKFRNKWEKMLQRRHSYTYVENGEVIGFISCIRKVGQEKHVAHLSPIMVRTSHVGNGIGKELMDFILKKIKEDGYKRVDLTVNADNQKAIALFRKFGFSEEGTLKKNTRKNGKFYNDKLMAKFF